MRITNAFPKIFILKVIGTKKNFENVQETIRKLYSFYGTLTQEQQNILKEIKHSQSVGIHVRRGDYIRYPDAFPMCQPEYYHNAITFIRSKFSQLKYFVFSDDIEWCRKELSFVNNPTFVENNEKSEAYKDMWMMSECKHNIIANSTFSWWSGWLNNNHEKIVIYPQSTSLTYASMPPEWKCL